MAIFTKEDLVNKEIGKLFLSTGTAYRQMAKAYSFDGAANSLIYNNTPDYLYNAGNTMADFTKGWVACEWFPFYGGGNGTTASMDKRNNGSVSFGQNSIKVTSTASAYNGQSVRTVAAVDLTDISRLQMNFKYLGSSGGSSYIKLWITPDLNFTQYKNHICIYTTSGKTNTMTSGKNYSITLDTSGYTGAYYVFASGCSGESNNVNFEINDIKVSRPAIMPVPMQVFTNDELMWTAKSNSDTAKVVSATGSDIKFKSSWYNNAADYACVVGAFKLDASQYSTLTVAMTVSGIGQNAYNYLKAGVHTDNSRGLTNTLTAQSSLKITADGQYIVTVDLSAIYGESYIYVGFYDNHSNASITVDSINLS
jgi:hypothetical protein